MRAITEPAAAAITPQLGHLGRGNSLQVFVAYGRHGDPVHTLRYAVLNRQGNNVVAPRDLRPTNGTAQHGWFHWVETDTPRRSIAAWHREVGGNMSVLINRFAFNGNPVHTTDITLTALAGDSQNAVIAPRPVLFDPPVPTPAAASLNTRRREYGVAWQHRPAPGAAWEIRFSRLNRDGTVAATRDVQVVSNIIDNTDPQLVWHTNGYGLAWLEELFPGAGRRLNFTVLDQNGARVDLRAFGAPAAAPAPNHRVSSPGADVRDFQLVWNGRSFRITWTEVNNGQLRHMQTAIAVPRQAGQVGYDQPYHHPSSALIRATLINGATNIRGTTLPNFGNNPNDGYGWGRVNLRQSLAPSPPVTFQVRDDNAVGSGRTVRYRFHLPANTLLLRATLCWTDPPGVRLVNNLHLSITDPGGRVFHGNTWDAAPNTHLSRPIAGAVPFDAVHNTEQIVLQNPLPGLYSVDVIAEVIPSANPFNQFPGQPFALVFVGSGAEVTFPAPTLAPGAIPAVY